MPDPVRSSKAFFVKTSGLRWLSLMLLAPVPWAGRVRELVLIGDSAFAALELLAALARHGVTCVTRLRLDAALYKPAPPRKPGTRGRPRTKGQRLASLSAALIDTA